MTKDLDKSKYLTPAEMNQLLDHLDREAIVAKAKGKKLPVRDEMAFRLALASGLRASELCDLQIRDLSLVRGQPPQLHVRHGKGDKERYVTLPSSLRKPLQDYLGWLKPAGFSREDHAPLIPTRAGKRISRTSLWRAWKKALDGAKLPSKPLHATRHTMGLLAYRTTKDMRMVQKQLGHSKMATTEIYADVMPEDIAEGMDAMWETTQKGPNATK